MSNKCLCMSCTKHSGITIMNLDHTNFRYGCEICGNKRCPHHSNHRYKCTESNETGQVGSVYE